MGFYKKEDIESHCIRMKMNIFNYGLRNNLRRNYKIKIIIVKIKISQDK